MKVKSAKRVKMVRGENIVASAIYGYYKNDKGKWEPEEKSSKVVRKMYEMALDGIPPSVIKDKLCEARYPTPREHIKLSQGKDINPEYLWTSRMVRHMLTNEQYTGTYISGKQIPKAIGSSSKILTDRSEWIIIPNSHPPIISEVDFQRVQDILSNRLKHTRTTKPINSWKEGKINCPKRKRVLNGESDTGTPIFGYFNGDKGKWTIDNQAANVIREIYDLASQGLSLNDIRTSLAEKEYPTPMVYQKIKRGLKVSPSYKWTNNSIRSILKNEQYTGAYVSGRILKNHATGKNFHVPREDWVVIPNKHSAIISKELFDRVQEIIANSRVKRKNMRPKDYLLRGKVKCGICGYALAYDSIETPVLRCHHTLADSTKECHKMKVVVNELDDALMDVIKVQAEVVLSTVELSGLQKPKINSQHRAEFECQVNQLTAQKQQIYEQLITGEIDLETYKLLKTDCNAQLKKIKAHLSLYFHCERENQSKEKVAAIAKQALDKNMSSKNIVDILIEKVSVFPDNNLEIFWKIEDFTLDT